MKTHSMVVAAFLFVCGSTALLANKLSATPPALNFSGTIISPSQSYAPRHDNSNHGSFTINVTPSANTEVSVNNATWFRDPALTRPGVPYQLTAQQMENPAVSGWDRHSSSMDTDRDRQALHDV